MSKGGSPRFCGEDASSACLNIHVIIHSHESKSFVNVRRKEIYEIFPVAFTVGNFSRPGLTGPRTLPPNQLLVHQARFQLHTFQSTYCKSNFQAIILNILKFSCLLILAESPYAIRLLLEKGANPNAQAADQRTALHMRVNNPESVHLLLKHGADPHLKDR